MNIDKLPFEDVCTYYDNVLNADKSTYKSSNDEPTPMLCVEELVQSIPTNFWKQKKKISRNLKYIFRTDNKNTHSIALFGSNHQCRLCFYRKLHSRERW